MVDGGGSGSSITAFVCMPLLCPVTPIPSGTTPNQLNAVCLGPNVYIYIYIYIYVLAQLCYIILYYSIFYVIICLCVYIYIYTHIYTHTYIYIYIYNGREKAE